ncbi:ankyrin repeat domain-containing protein [Legionella sp. W05-934-2]|uniref:ankyrin repeat domain-containing protein n=1 Tax=Legionella sp. W05-934-2 TaxID=1198649 RepID=UPI003461DCB3
MPSLPGLTYLANYPTKDLWRLFVDGRFWAKEKGWEGYEKREAGSLSAGLESLFYFAMKANETKDFAISVELIKEIHARCGKGVTELEDKSPGEPRDHETVSFAIPASKATSKGVAELLGIEFLMKNAEFGPGTPSVFAAHISTNQLEEAKKKPHNIDNLGLAIYQQMVLDGYENSTHFYIAPRDNVEEILHFLTASYNKEIQQADTLDKKITIIARYTKYYEILHPFKDANGRTFVNILMNIMLMKEGLPPATFYEPNVFDLYSSEELAHVIKESMYNTLHIIDAHKTSQKLSLYGFQESASSNFLDVFKSPSYATLTTNKKAHSTIEVDDKAVLTVFSSLGKDYPLHWAVVYETGDGILADIISNNKKDINRIIPEGAPPLYVGRTPLHIATLTNNKTMFDLLLKNGADSTAQDYSSKTILHYIAEYNNPELLVGNASILKNFKLLSAQDQQGKTALHYAAASGNSDLIKMLLIDNPDYLNKQDKDQKTALHYAAEAGNLELVQLLITTGAKVDVTDSAGHSPMSLACKTKQKAVMTTLIDTGPRIDETTLSLLANHKDIEMFNRMLTKIPGLLKDETTFRYALALGDPDIVDRFLSAGMDINTVFSSDGSTPILKAALFNYSKLIAFLAKKNANVNITFPSGENLFHIIAISSKPELIIEGLKMKEAPTLLFQQNKAGESPIIRLARNRSLLPIIKHNIDLKAPVDNKGNTILHAAMVNLDIPAIEAILTKEPSLINSTNSKGQTPLCYAIENMSDYKISSSQKELIDLNQRLATYKVDFTAKDSSGNTAIDYAIARGWFRYSLSLITQNDKPKLRPAINYLESLTESNFSRTKDTFKKTLLSQLSDNPIVAATQLDELYRDILQNRIKVPQNYKQASILDFFSKATPEQVVHNEILKQIDLAYRNTIIEIPSYLASDSIRDHNKKEEIIALLPDYLRQHKLAQNISLTQVRDLQSQCYEAIESKSEKTQSNVNLRHH